jgi:hypothetical protein
MSTIDRRSFGAALVASGAGVVGATEALAANAPATGKEGEGNAGGTAPPQSPLAAASEVDLLVELALRDVHKEHRTLQVVTEIRLDVERNLGLEKTVARFPLENGDAPATPFRAYRAD